MEDYGERLSETDEPMDTAGGWNEEEEEHRAGDGGGAWDDGDGLFWQGDADQGPRVQTSPKATPRRFQQADLRQWFGGVPKPPPQQKRLVPADIRSFFGGGGPRPAQQQPQPGAGKRQRRGADPVTGEREAQPPQQQRKCPFYKIVQGAPIAVDAFSFGRAMDREMKSHESWRLQSLLGARLTVAVFSSP